MRRSLALRALVAAALLVSAWVHATLPSGPVAAGGQLTLAGLFLAHAVVAAVVAAWLLLVPRPRCSPPSAPPSPGPARSSACGAAPQPLVVEPGDRQGRTATRSCAVRPAA